MSRIESTAQNHATAVHVCDEASSTPRHAMRPAEPSELRGGESGLTARAELRTLRRVHDPRGDLTAGEVGRDVPFPIRRYFLIFGVPNSEQRGEHAHRRCAQFLVAARGSVCVAADDGRRRQEWTLNQPNLGVYLPPMVWGSQYCYSADAVLMVLASHPYDAADYIRSYEEFTALATARRVP